MWLVSFQIWRIMVIEVHKQPAEGVRFPVTSRRFSSKTKRVEKGIVIAAPWHIGTKAQREWFILLPSLKRETMSLRCLCLSSAGGVPGEGSTMQDSRLWSLSPYLFYAERQCAQKERGEQRFWPRAIWCRPPRACAWDIFETQMHFVTEEKTRWEAMTTHEN